MTRRKEFFAQARMAALMGSQYGSCEPQHAQTKMHKQQRSFERPSAHTKPYSRQEPDDQAGKVEQIEIFRGIIPQLSHGAFTAPQRDISLRFSLEVPNFTQP